MSITRAGDFIYAMRFVTLLTMPWKDQAAYKLGIIDGEGNRLKRYRDLRTGEERDAFTYFHRIVFNIKRLLAKVSGGDKFLVDATASFLLLKEALKDLDLSDATLREMEEAIFAYCEDTPTNVTGAAVSTDTPKGKGKVARRKDIEVEDPEDVKTIKEAKGFVDKNHGKPPKPSKSKFKEDQQVAVYLGAGKTVFGKIKYLDIKSGGDLGASVVLNTGERQFFPYKQITSLEDFRNSNPYQTKLDT